MSTAIGVEQPRSVGNPLRGLSPEKPASRVIMFLTREAGFSVIQTSVSNRCHQPMPLTESKARYVLNDGDQKIIDAA